MLLPKEQQLMLLSFQQGQLKLYEMPKLTYKALSKGESVKLNSGGGGTDLEKGYGDVRP